jgi:glycosyltransferase involved in cell wall biosynthesis
LKFAYFGLPHIGGTYSVFKHLRSGLADFGVEVRWLGMGPWSAIEDPTWQPDLSFGEIVDPQGSEPERHHAARLVNAIANGRFDGVFVNVLADRVQTNIVRYLPHNILRIMIVHSITPGTYAAARSIRDHVHASVGVSERCRRDLIAQFGFHADRTFAIPNAVDVAPFIALSRPPRPRHGLRVIYLGRVDDTPKGVFWLPKIMDALACSVTLTIAGNGPDLEALKRSLSRHTDRVTFLGSVAPDRIPELLAAYDVLVMPSRFEGFGLSIVEAMAAGCVPVASRIRLVTDTIIDHGENGFLFPVGDWGEAAVQIETLNRDPVLLDRMSKAARQKAQRGFDLGRTATEYSRLIESLGTDPPAIAAPLKIDNWSMPAGLRAGLRTYLPRPVKNWLRVLREHA